MGYELFGYDITKELPIINCSLVQIAIFILVIVLGILIVRIIGMYLKTWLMKLKVGETLAEFMTRLVRIILYIFVVGLAFSFVGINLGSVLVSISVVLGLVLGFALGDTLSNVASGTMLAIANIFKVGDFVTVNGESGYVKRVAITVTELDTVDNKRVIIPNKLVFTGNIINFTRNNTRRVDMTIGVSYDDDLDKVIKVTHNLLKRHKMILKDPPPQVEVLEWADSSVNLVVRPWVKTDDYWTVFFDIKKRLKQTFDKQDITIPFPQRDLHIIDPNPPPKKRKRSKK